MTRQLVLASTSPFRREILDRLGHPFDTFSPNVDETRLETESPGELVERLAVAKAMAADSAYPDALVIGGDQVATVDGEILGKPGHRERAIDQLTRSSGKRVRFLSGLCLRDTRKRSNQVVTVPFDVQFRQLTRAQIEYYVDHEQPFNAAGSFKSEGLGIAMFEGMYGDDPTALIGLPLIRLTSLLQNAGFEVLG